jgi:hypothetical protein
MTKLITIIALCLFFVGCLSKSAFSQAEVMTNAEVMSLTKAGLDKEVIINKIRQSQTKFDVSTDALILLKQSGVDSEVVKEMLASANVDRANAAPTNKTISEPTGTSVVIPDGTEVKVITIEEVSGKHSVEGDQLNFKVAEDVVVNGNKVIAKDTIVKATVTAAKKPGFAGTSGKLSIRLDSTKTIDGQDVRLRASKAGNGGTNTGTTVAMVVFLGPIGLLKHGKDAKLPAGTALSGFTDEAKTVLIGQQKAY